MSEIWSWCHDQFPGQRFVVPDHPVGEELFTNVQPELPLMQLHVIPSVLSPVTKDQHILLHGSPLPTIGCMSLGRALDVYKHYGSV